MSFNRWFQITFSRTVVQRAFNISINAASEGTVAEIVINANDGTQGEVIFAPQSVS